MKSKIEINISVIDDGPVVMRCQGQNTSKGKALDALEDAYLSTVAQLMRKDLSKAEQEEADAERSNRRDKYYRDNGDKLTKARPHIYLFSQDDLDNEDVILDVESIPTFNRTKPMLNEIKKKSAPEQVREEQPVKDKVVNTSKDR